MKVFKSKEFINKLNWLVNDVPNYYFSKNGTWCDYNWNNNKFMMDCVVSIKGLLWGFKADKNKPHGGGIYGSNGVADFGANDGINYCTSVSTNFNNLKPGEYLCMYNTQYNHAGIYIGNGKVFECTTGWNVNKCIISSIDNNGYRYYNGQRLLKWTYHGLLQYIDYTDQDPEPTPQPSNYKIGDVVNINGVYISSDSTNKLNPAITVGTITKILNGARNPYLLNNGDIGWVNNDCITGIALNDIKVGDNVVTTSTGNGASDGSSNTAISGIRGTVTRIITGAKYPYLVSKNGVPMGWYKKESLKLI